MDLKYGITLANALEVSPLKDGRILAGHKGLDRIVTQVNIMEVPDIINWVKGGQLLLTAAYSIKDNSNILTEMIPILEQKGLAGLGVKLKRYIDKIPEETLVLANKLNFPVIEIPYDLPFPDIMSPIMAEIFNKHVNILMRTEIIHGKFMEVVLKGRGLEGIVYALSEILGNPVEITEYLLDTSYSSSYESFPDSTVAVPILSERNQLGIIKTWEKNRKLDSTDHRALDFASTVAALEILKQQAIKQVSIRYVSEFVEDILSNDEGVREEAFKRAQHFNFRLGDNHSVMIVHLGEIKKSLYNGDTKDIVKTSLEKSIYVIESSFRSHNSKVLIAQKTDILTIVYTIPKQFYGKEKEFSNQMAEEILRIIGSESRGIRIGLGSYYKEYQYLFKGFTEARKAIEIAPLFKDKNIINYSDLGFYRLLASTPQGELEKYYNETIMPLMDYDTKKDTSLVETLEQYFICNGNLKKISEKMYTHYNTILYRIQRIQEITKFDLQNPIDRLNLEIGLRIKNLLK